jgi:hypothetical protein
LRYSDYVEPVEHILLSVDPFRVGDAPNVAKNRNSWMPSLISENRTEPRNKSLKVTVVTDDIAFVMINVTSERATSSPISDAD